MPLDLQLLPLLLIMTPVEFLKVRETGPRRIERFRLWFRGLDAHVRHSMEGVGGLLMTDQTLFVVDIRFRRALLLEVDADLAVAFLATVLPL